MAEVRKREVFEVPLELSRFVEAPAGSFIGIAGAPDGGLLLGDICFYGHLGEPMVRIKPDGRVILAEGATVDEAARVFWDAVERMRRR